MLKFIAQWIFFSVIGDCDWEAEHEKLAEMTELARPQREEGPRNCNRSSAQEV